MTAAIKDIRRAPRPQELFEENRHKFNEAVAQGLKPDFSFQNLSDLDLSCFDLHNANLAGAYLRGVILSGVDLSDAYLHGASMKGARVSGCLFPPEIQAQEIWLSLEKGTRIRHLKPQKQG